MKLSDKAIQELKTVLSNIQGAGFDNFQDDEVQEIGVFILTILKETIKL